MLVVLLAAGGHFLLPVLGGTRRCSHLHSVHVHRVASFINGSRAGLLAGGCEVVVGVVMVAVVVLSISVAGGLAGNCYNHNLSPCSCHHLLCRCRASYIENVESSPGMFARHAIR